MFLREQPRADIKPEWPLSRKIKVWLLLNIIPFLAYPIIRAMTATYRWRYKVPPGLLELMASDRPFVVAIRHGDMLPSQSLGKLLGWSDRVAIMVSLSQIGEIEARLLKVLRYYVVRGSEKERTKEALEDIKGIVNQGAIAAMVVDGPSGPAKKVKPGVIYLAKHCKIPIVPLVFMPGREIRLPTWDKTRIPIPFSRCIVTSVDPIVVPDEMDDSEFDNQIEKIEDVFAGLEKREITWDGAKKISMKLLNIYGIRDGIDFIDGAVSGHVSGHQYYDDFAGGGRSLDRVFERFGEIYGLLKKVRSRIRKRYPGMLLENMDEINDVISGGNPGTDTERCWNTLKKNIPDLKKSIDFIIEKEFSFDA
jgi:lysophospholipid acyltransferase (LPLAT)-like uncharacterized protein